MKLTLSNLICFVFVFSFCSCIVILYLLGSNCANSRLLITPVMSNGSMPPSAASIKCSNVQMFGEKKLPIKCSNLQMFGKKTFWLFPRLKNKLQLKVEPNKNVQMTEGRVFGVYFFVRIQQHLSLLARAHLRTWRNSISLSYNVKVYNVPLAKCS